MLEVYLLRHGIAEEGLSGNPDSMRALVPEGKRKLREVLKVAKAARVEPALIVTSPYKRARQTAEIAADVFDYGGQILESTALIPSGSPSGVWDEIRAHRAEDSLLLVGHDPLFSQLVGYLLASPSMQVEFKKGALVRIDFDQFPPQPRGWLRWMLPPRLAGAD